MTKPKIRILVVDDHPIVRAGIAATLEDAPDLCVVGDAGSGPAALEFLAHTAADVVLMDLRMPGGDGVQATAGIRERYPEVRVLILTTYESDDAILDAIEAGASGYLLKAAPEEEILAGVRAVSVGKTVLAPEIAASLVARVRAPRGPRVMLTPREREVLKLVAAGRTNGQIALTLGVTEATVKTHLVRSFEKLGVGDRTRAVTLALELGLIG